MSLVFWQICNHFRLATFSTESAKTGREQLQKNDPLFDHFVGEHSERGMDREAQFLRGDHIDDKFKFNRGLHR